MRSTQLYGQWDEDAHEPVADRECWRVFSDRIVDLDQSGYLAYTLTTHKRLVLNLLDDRYLSRFFWRDPRGLQPAQTLVVVGLGGLGLHAIQCGLACGARVIAVDSVQSKLKMAAENGAHFCVDSSSPDFGQQIRDITGGKGADAVVVFRPHAEVIEPSIKLAKPGGTVVMVAYIDIGKTFNPDQRFMQGMEVRVVGARGNTRQELAEVVQLVIRKQLHPLIAGTYPLDQVNTALAQLATGEVTGRIVLIP